MNGDVDFPGKETVLLLLRPTAWPPAEPAGRTVRMLGRTYPFVAPNIRDPRLHLAAVIISIHVLGQIGLGFRVSVPQILVAIVVCAVIEVGWTLWKTGTPVWPASATLFQWIL